MTLKSYTVQMVECFHLRLKPIWICSCCWAATKLVLYFQRFCLDKIIWFLLFLYKRWQWFCHDFILWQGNNPSTKRQDWFFLLDVLTWTIECTPTVCIAWLSSSDAIATKLNPRKSWCALALGGIPGESEKDIIYLQAESFTYRYEIKYWNFGSTLNL